MMTREERCIYFRNYRAAKIAKGICVECKRPAGGPNGTKRRCGICAERQRGDGVIRYYRQHPNKPPELSKWAPVLVKKQPEPAEKRRVTWLELSSGASNC